jgi:hypothetical protein
MGGYPAYQVARNPSNSRATCSRIPYALNVSRPLPSVVGLKIPLEECPFVVSAAPQASTAFNRPLQSPTVDALHDGSDSLACTSTGLGPPPKDSIALIADRPDMSQKIPEKPVVAPEDVRHEYSHGEDGNIPSRFR